MGCEKVVWWEFSSQHNSSSSKSIIGSTKKKCFLSGQKIYIFRENNEGGEGDEHNEIYILLKWCRASWWWIKDSDNIEIKGLLAIYISSSFAVVFIANTLPFKSELKVLWNAENFQKNSIVDDRRWKIEKNCWAFRVLWFIGQMLAFVFLANYRSMQNSATQ